MGHKRRTREQEGRESAISPFLSQTSLAARPLFRLSPLTESLHSLPKSAFIVCMWIGQVQHLNLKPKLQFVVELSLLKTLKVFKSFEGNKYLNWEIKKPSSDRLEFLNAHSCEKSEAEIVNDVLEKKSLRYSWSRGIHRLVFHISLPCSPASAGEIVNYQLVVSSATKDRLQKYKQWH